MPPHREAGGGTPRLLLPEETGLSIAAQPPSCLLRGTLLQPPARLPPLHRGWLSPPLSCALEGEVHNAQQAVMRPGAKEEEERNPSTLLMDFGGLACPGVLHLPRLCCVGGILFFKLSLSQIVTMPQRSRQCCASHRRTRQTVEGWQSDSTY